MFNNSVDNLLNSLKAFILTVYYSEKIQVKISLRKRLTGLSLGRDPNAALPVVLFPWSPEWPYLSLAMMCNNTPIREGHPNL